MTTTFPTVAPTPPTPLSFSHSPDLTTLLTGRPKERLLALRQHVSDLRALCPPFADRHEAANAKIAAENALKRLQEHPSRGGFGLSKADARVVAAEATLERCARESERLSALYDSRSAVWTGASHVLSAVETYLKNGIPGGVVLEDFDGPEPQLLKGETIVDGIERIRRRVRELKADLHRIASSPYPSSHCKAKLRTQLTELAARGAVSVSRLVERDGDIEFPTTQVTVPVRGTQGGSATVQQIDVAALVCWLHKSAMLAALDREIDNESDDKAAMTHEAREKAEAVVRGDMLAVERDEAALMFEGWSEGLPITPRADIDPVAVLNVELRPAPAVSASGTTPGYSFNFLRR